MLRRLRRWRRSWRRRPEVEPGQAVAVESWVIKGVPVLVVWYGKAAKQAEKCHEKLG